MNTAFLLQIYTFGNRNQTAGNAITAVTITPNSNVSPGAVSNIRYNGNAAVPQTPGTYAVTFDVAAATGWNFASGLSAGNLVVNQGNQTPNANHYSFGNREQTEGNVITAVTITPNSNASPGAVNNIRYNGNAAVPQTAGTYAVTFDVAAAAGWNFASGLSAGNLVVNEPEMTNDQHAIAFQNFAKACGEKSCGRSPHTSIQDNKGHIYYYIDENMPGKNVTANGIIETGPVLGSGAISIDLSNVTITNKTGSGKREFTLTPIGGNSFNANLDIDSAK